MPAYLAFILKERRVLSFGAAMTFFSSFGQTFLIALFVPDFLEEFSLSNGDFGSVYSLATLGSALLLPSLGGRIDRMPVKHYSVLVAALLAAASVVMAVSWSVVALFTAILLLRLGGQGLSSHTADTTMAKAFGGERGKALSISSLGHPIGEGLLPLAVAGLGTFLLWRDIWWLFAASLGLVVAPALHRLIRSHPVNGMVRPSEASAGGTIEQTMAFGIASVWRFPNPFGNWALLKDPRLKFVLPAALIPPFWVTAFFLYQVSFGEELGWKAARIASSFLVFAVSRVATSLIIGPLIDRFTAHRLFAYYLIPLMLALAFPLVLPSEWSIFAYMMFIGISMGIGNPIKSALWAEMYGVDSIGAVRSLFASLMIFGTSLSPFIMGFLLDSRIPLRAIFGIAIVTTFLSMVLSLPILRGTPKAASAV